MTDQELKLELLRIFQPLGAEAVPAAEVAYKWIAGISNSVMSSAEQFLDASTGTEDKGKIDKHAFATGGVVDPEKGIPLISVRGVAILPLPPADQREKTAEADGVVKIEVKTLDTEKPPLISIVERKPQTEEERLIAEHLAKRGATTEPNYGKHDALVKLAHSLAYDWVPAKTPGFFVSPSVRNTTVPHKVVVKSVKAELKRRGLAIPSFLTRAP